MADKTLLIQPDKGQEATDIHLVNREGFAEWVKKLSAGQRAALAAQKFDGSGSQVAIVPDGDRFFAVGAVPNPQVLSSWCLARLAEVLPEGTYRRARKQSPYFSMPKAWANVSFLPATCICPNPSSKAC